MTPHGVTDALSPEDVVLVRENWREMRTEDRLLLYRLHPALALRYHFNASYNAVRSRTP